MAVGIHFQIRMYQIGVLSVLRGIRFETGPIMNPFFQGITTKFPITVPCSTRSCASIV